MLGVSTVCAETSPNLNSPAPSGARPWITADPLEVQISGDLGTSKIIWDTGNQGAGAIYLLADGNDTLFLQGSKGKADVPWIQAGESYVFNLFSGTDRNRLLATVTVRGVKPAGHPRSFRWFIAVAVVAFLYLGIVYGAPMGKAPPHSREVPPTPDRINIARNLLIGLAAFLLLDAALFHSSLYSSIVLRESIMGHVRTAVEDEKHRLPSGRRETLVLGDSRLEEGFSETLADDLSTSSGFKFVNLAVRGTTPFIWYYFVREVDPRVKRYDAIVISIDYRDRYIGLGYGSMDRPADFHSAASLLRYTDAFALSTAFPDWTSKCRGFAACVLRGYAFQPDILDLLEHPFTRFHQLKEQLKPGIKEQREIALRSYKGKKGRLSGDVPVGRDLDPALRRRRDIDQWQAYRERWIGGILQRYANSQTKIILVQLPRGPNIRPPRTPEDEQSSIASLIKNDRTILLDENLFRNLEKPEYFFDAMHVNAFGRELLTKRLTSEVMHHLSPESQPPAVVPAAAK